MSEHVQTTDLNTVLDVTRGASRRDANNLALADQIQFSSILRMLVDTPEQTIAVAQAATQSREDEDSRPETPERTRPERRTERSREGKAEEPRHHRIGEQHADRPDIAPLRTKVITDGPELTPDIDSMPNALSPAERLLQNPEHGTRIGLETLRAPEAVAALVASRTAEKGLIDGPEFASAKPQAMLIQAAQSMASSALADDQFSTVGQDLHDAVMHRFANVGGRVGAQTAASSLKDHQEADLTSRLNAAAPVAIQVDLAGDAAKTRSAPLHTLAGSASMAGFDGLDGEPHLFAQTFGRGNGENLGSENKAPTHGNLVPERPAAGTGGPDAPFNQALRAQGALLAAQQAGQAGSDAKAPVLPSDVIQNIGAAPSGPSQVSQTAKANPATAARQPERPQPPAEQIAVKIRQAVSEGLDKINIKLNPANLGRVEVRLEIKDGHIAATVLAERKETLELLQRDARGLERALLDAGLRTDIQSLSFGMRGEPQRQFDANRDRRGHAAGRETHREDDAPGDRSGIGKTSGDSRNLRPTKGVDIRV